MGPSSGFLATAMIGLLAVSAPAAEAAPAEPQRSTTIAPRLSAAQSIPPAELEALVDGLVRDAMIRDHIAGLTVSVVQDGRVILKKGYGYAGPGRPVDPDRTLFRIGSISKTFTWIAVMKEVEAGRMRLDAPVNAYLPPDLQVPDAGFSEPIRIRDLMTHTPGFEDNPLHHLFISEPAAVSALETRLRENRPARVRPPGETESYSNYGASLAGAAVAHLEGVPFETVVEREITGPLGMTSTTFREPYGRRAGLPDAMSPELAARVSTGYRYLGGTFKAQPFEFVTGSAPAGAGSSTAGDMARYMLMILGDGQSGGARIYGASTAAGFRTPLMAAAPGLDAWDDGFMDVGLPGGFRGHGHGGDTLWFHSTMMTVPELRLGVFASANTETAAPFVSGALVQRIVERFYAPPAREALPGAPEIARDRAVYAGVYLANRRPYSGLPSFVFRLIGQIPIGVTPDGRIVTPRPGGGLQSWTLSGTPGVFRETDGPARMAFKVENGRAVRWYPPTGSEAFDRVGPLHQTPVLAAMAALAAAGALLAWTGRLVRPERARGDTGWRKAANRLQLAAAGLWLASFGAITVFAASAADQASVVLNWPSPWLVLASGLGLAAALTSTASLVTSPLVWSDGGETWSLGRRVRFTLTSLILAGLGAQLALWGALEPWAT